MKSALESQHLQYAYRIHEAAASLKDKVATHPELAEPPDPKLVSGVAEMFEMAFQIAKRQDVTRQCTELESKFLQQTFESIRNDMEEALNRLPVPGDKKASSP